MWQSDIFDRSVVSTCYISTEYTSLAEANKIDISSLPKGVGSGFVWDKQGHIVTNFHVINKVDNAIVTLTDPTKKTSKKYKAKLTGVDPDKDIAVLKIEAPADELVPLVIGNSTTLRIGQSALAIGATRCVVVAPLYCCTKLLHYHTYVLAFVFEFLRLFLSFCVCFAHVFQRSTKSEPDLARHASFDTSRLGPMYTHSQTYIHTHIISNMHIFPHTHQAIRLGKASHSLRELCLEKKGKFSHPLEERSMELFRYVQSNVQHTYTHRCIDTYKGKFSHPQEERFMELFR
jgi:hypothetical protein